MWQRRLWTFWNEDEAFFPLSRCLADWDSHMESIWIWSARRKSWKSIFSHVALVSEEFQKKNTDPLCNIMKTGQPLFKQIAWLRKCYLDFSFVSLLFICIVHWFYFLSVCPTLDIPIHFEIKMELGGNYKLEVWMGAWMDR